MALVWSGQAMAGSDDPNEPAQSQEVIVIGEKADRTLQETTTSVAVTTPRRIADENLLSLQDVYQRTANVTETYGVSGFTIRGIANQGITGGGDAALSTVYVDGAPMPSSMLQAAPTDMFDIAQVEILRGPQSTLQGLNALAGAVIVQTTEPTQTWTARARAMYTDADESQFAAAVGGPIVPGELAFRVTAEKRDADGFTWNPTRNTNENPLDSFSLRGKLLWTPDSLPGFEARLGYTHYHRNGGYRFSYTDTTVPDFYDNRLNFSNYPNDSRSNTDIGTIDLRYKFNDRLSLTSVSSYNEIGEKNRYDNDLTAIDGGSYDQRNRFKTFTQEVRLNYDGERYSGLIGGFYYNRKQTAHTTSLVGVPTPVSTISALLQGSGFPAPTADAVAALYAQALPAIPVNFASDTAGRVKTMALFADGRWRLTDRFSVLAGFRYDHERNSTAVSQVTTFAGTYPDPAAFGPPGSPLFLAVTGINAGVEQLVSQATGSAVAIDRTFNAFLPKAGVEMQWTKDVLTAFTVQRGYRSGGSSTNLARSQTFAYDPEYTWNYELSLRTAWLNNRLTVNANAFYVDWKNQQTNVNFGLNAYDINTVNAGRSHLYGFEVEAAYRVNQNFDLYASLGHVRTKFDEFTVNVGSFTDLTGLEFAYAPRWTLAGGFNVRFLDRAKFNLNASHRSPVFAEAAVPQSDTRLGARTLVNAQLAYDIGNWTLSAFASNIFNEKYFQYRTTFFPQAVLGNPRVVGLAAEVKW